MKRGGSAAWPADEVEAAARGTLGRRLERDEHAALRRYAETLLTWNRVHRVVGPSSLGAIARDLIIDALLFRPLLPSGAVRVLDLGAGAGVPGIPLLITDPALELVLLEERRKRVSFMLAVARELGLGRAEVVHGRAEQVLADRPDLAEAFDAVLARCVAKAPPLAEMAWPFIKPGGMLVMSGPPGAAGHSSPAGPGGPLGPREVAVPALGIRRSFLVSRKSD